MKSLEEQQNDFKEYEKIFSRKLKADPKAQLIMSLEVREHEKSTFEIVLTLSDGTVTTATVPGCVSGENESFIVYYTNYVASPPLIGQDPLQQMSKIDDILSDLLKKTVQLFEKSSLKKLAGNVSWAVSVAVCKAGARSKNISIYKYLEEVDYNPKSQSEDSESEDSQSEDVDFRTENYLRRGMLSPAFNISNGVLDLEEKFTKQFQHLVIIPAYPDPFHRRIQMVRKIYQDLKKCYEQDAINKSGYSPSFNGIEECLASLKTIIDKLEYKKEVSIGVNIGVSKFGEEDDKTYPLNFENQIASGDDLVDFYKELDVALIEDPFHVNDMVFSSKLTSEAKFWPALVVLENDGIFVDSKSFWSANDAGVCNAQLLKVDQLGTVKKCIEAVSRCKAAGWGTIMCSHYSCETSDSFLADLCVGLKLDQLKIGISCISSPCQTCKRVAEIEMAMIEEVCKKLPKSLVSMYNHVKNLRLDDVPEHKRHKYVKIKGLTVEEFIEMRVQERRDMFNFGASQDNTDIPKII